MPSAARWRLAGGPAPVTEDTYDAEGNYDLDKIAFNIIKNDDALFGGGGLGAVAAYWGCAYDAD